MLIIDHGVIAADGSLYFSLELFVFDGLRFANPPQSMKGLMNVSLVIAGLIGMVIIVGLQWLFIFQNKMVTTGTIVAFGVVACAITNRSLHHLQTNILYNLHRIGAGRTVMFKEVQI